VIVSSAQADRLRRQIDELAATWAVPGGVVVAATGNDIIFEHAFGFADVDRGVLVSPTHLFEIGSISKIFTAAVIVQLAEEGVLRLDQPIGEVLDWLPPALTGSELTIERLLQHSAGLISGVDAVPDQVAQVASFVGGVSSAEPGSWFHYSNLGYILLGLAAEQTGGVTLAESVRERILKPLGMLDTIATVANADYDLLARGYRARCDDRPWLPGDPQILAHLLEVDGADGAIAGTGADLALLVQSLLTGASKLSPSALETMTSRQGPAGEEVVSLRGLPDTQWSRYGLGINTESTGGRLVLSHGGGMVGYASFLLADVDAGLGVVALTNANGVGPIAEVIARVVAAELSDAVTVGPLDPEVWADESDRSPHESRPRAAEQAMLGRFVVQLPDGSADELAVALQPRAQGAGLELEHGGLRAALQWSWGESIVTSHPDFPPFPLHFAEDGWTWGPRIYRRALPAIAGVPAAGWAAYPGHYRGYSPWYPNFRVVDREGLLLLISAPAVESPGDEVPLVALEPGLFRIGADPRLPERLIFGPVINGRSAWVDRDGCRYSRSFID
jgi:D-alanyl-D-alanine carboxypeptidase